MLGLTPFSLLGDRVPTMTRPADTSLPQPAQTFSCPYGVANSGLLMIPTLQSKKGILWLRVIHYSQGTAEALLPSLESGHQLPEGIRTRPLFMEFYFTVSRAGYGLVGWSLGKSLSDDNLCWPLQPGTPPTRAAFIGVLGVGIHSPCPN